MSMNSSSRLPILGQDQSFTTSEGLAGIPQDVAEFIGDRPIIKGEDAGQYDRLLSKLIVHIKPTDPIEWILTKAAADADWEARRERRMRDQILELYRYNAMRQVAENLLQTRRLEPDFHKVVADMVSSWSGPDGEAKMAEFLAEHGLDPSVIVAEAFLNRSQFYDLLERMAAAADKRRDAALRDIDRHRAGRVEPIRKREDAVDVEEVIDETPRLPALPPAVQSYDER